MDKPDKAQLVIAGYKYHPQSGSTLIIAHVPGRLRVNKAEVKRAQHINNGYIVAWVPPGQRYIDKYTGFDSYHSAYVHFMSLKNGGPPDVLPYTRDFQQKRVYEWQWKNIKGYNKKISMKKAKTIVDSISEEFNLRAPGLNFRKDRYDNYCYFETERHEIGGHHHLLNIGNIVHECAHLVDTHRNQNIFQVHGPSFVRDLIRLAVQYIPGNDEQKLLKSAKEAGLLGLPEEIRYVEPPQNPVVLPARPYGPMPDPSSN